MTDDDKGCLVVLAALAGVILIAAILLLPTHEIKVQVTATYWVHEQQVQNYIPRRYGDWEERVPADAYDRNRWSKVRSTTKHCTSYDKHFNCTSSYTTDNYDWWVDYTADRWDYERSQVVNGNNNDPHPFWPTPDFRACEALQCERAGGTTERYTITYTREDKSTFTCDTNGVLYGEYMVGQSYSIEDGAIIHIPRCDTIKGNSR